MGTPIDNLRNDIPLIRAIHTAVKGRARYKVSGLHDSEALKRYLELRLSEEEIIAQARASHLTGNILVIFHPDKSPNAIALLLQEIVLDYTKQARTSPVTSTVTGSSIAKVQENLKQLDQAGNRLVLVSVAVGTLISCTVLLRGYGLDKAILLAIQKLHTPLLDRIMLGVTFLGEPLVLLLVCLGLGTGLRHYKRRSEITTLTTAAFGAISLNFLLKELFCRARPALWNYIVNVRHYSFPSGHAMVSMVIYGFLGYLLAKQFPQYRRRIFALSAVLIVAIGFSRLYLGVHWPTDVVAGYAAGLVWLTACILSLELEQKYRFLGASE
ncbi:phosphatase PAP2 family protein [Fischerella sp. PCC 9605]|uniref:phosphatase PAP2 family protein n=1 Tax=Fischerella sp. PCC 9605 TaxID=1173024 RepID=UPI00047A369C|nr:phosphatase PAP2 family protein [Fischerella sp. PCC 9605]